MITQFKTPFKTPMCAVVFLAAACLQGNSIYVLGQSEAVQDGVAATTTGAAEQTPEQTPEEKLKYPLVYSTDFEKGIENWELMGNSWKVVERNGSKVLSLHQKASDLKPKHRSPLHLAMLKDVQVSDFTLDVRVLSTHPDYGHRDVCLFFGYQGPTQFYYVHLGQKADPRCNQIFIVNQADRTKISLTTTEGTPWDDQWHDVRIIRHADSGEIAIYFDDMKTPAMTAKDKTFSWGRVGLGSFDDTADFDDLKLHGIEIKSPAATEATEP